MAEHLLEIENLHTSFNIPSGEVRSVNGISFNVDKNEVLGIVGESGSGKSVTAYSIMQILEKPGRVVAGSIKFKGQDILNIPHKQMQRIRGEKISIIFQDSMISLNPVWSIGNQLKECLKSHPNIPAYKVLRDKVTYLKKLVKESDGKNIELKEQLKVAQKEYRDFPHKRCLEMLQLVGINEPEKRLKQYPFEFSGGMLQRVMIAMALICEPELIIADEPTTALDVTIQAQILELLVSIQKKMGMGIIIITHDLGVVAQICDKINVMYAGRIVESGTCDDIFYNPKHEYTKGLINSIPKMQKRTGEKLKPIPGNPVDVFRLPSGCSFAPRCEKCMKVCLEKYPRFLDVSSEHKTACFNFLKELIETDKITKEKYDEYLNYCQSGNKSCRKITLFDIDYALQMYKEAKENYKKADKSQLSQDEIELLKYKITDAKNGYYRAKKDFKNYLRNYFQSRPEKKSIDKNDVHKKYSHNIHDFKLVVSKLNDETFKNYLDKIVFCTSAVNYDVNVEQVSNAKKAYLTAKKNHFKYLLKYDVVLHNNYFEEKINYYDLLDALRWKNYITKIKAHTIKVLKKIYNKKGVANNNEKRR